MQWIYSDLHLSFVYTSSFFFLFFLFLFVAFMKFGLGYLGKKGCIIISLLGRDWR